MAGCALLCACGLAPAVARAKPHTGFALFAGPVLHQGNVQLADGEIFGFVSTGVEVGAEYQRVLGPEFSLVGFAEGSLESISGDAAQFYAQAGHGYAGAQLRYWNGGKFVAAQAGVYTEVLFPKAGSGAAQTQANGWAYGVGGGYESDRGWFGVAQVDLAQVAYTNAAHGLTGIRVNLGYRWGSG